MAKEQNDPSTWWSDHGMSQNTPVFPIELNAGVSLWIPSGRVHLVRTLQEVEQVCHNLIPKQVIPRAIVQWRHKRKTLHARTPCVLPCVCQQPNSRTVVAQHLRTKPAVSASAAQLLRCFLIEERRDRNWLYFCSICHSLDDTLAWLQAKVSFETVGTSKSAKKRRRAALLL